MSRFFSRLFSPTHKSGDGLTQDQREAVIDLLNFCMYADDRLTLAEDKVVADQLERCHWEPAVPLELFVSRSVTRARDALESPERRTAFLADVARRLGESEARTRALALSKQLLNADGSYAPGEKDVFLEIERAFGWPA